MPCKVAKPSLCREWVLSDWANRISKRPSAVSVWILLYQWGSTTVCTRILFIIDRQLESDVLRRMSGWVILPKRHYVPDRVWKRKRVLSVPFEWADRCICGVLLNRHIPVVDVRSGRVSERVVLRGWHPNTVRKWHVP